jgi:hypothetical protein
MEEPCRRQRFPATLAAVGLLLAASACETRVVHLTGDDGTCDPVACASYCRAAGLSGGNCESSSCFCYDGAADADADADVREDVVRDEASVREDGHGPEDVGRRDDGGPPCPSELGGPCNAVLQCGCAAGERCLLGESLVEECAPSGTDPIDALCGAVDNCMPQNQCFGNSAADVTCRQFCYVDEDCPASRTCDFAITGVAGYRLCGYLGDPCDPVTGDGCPADEACVVVPPAAGFECWPAGTTGPGEPCGVEDCRIGTGCYTTDGVSFLCYEYCDLDGIRHPCPAGLVCSNGLGSTTIGLCTPG